MDFELFIQGTSLLLNPFYISLSIFQIGRVRLRRLTTTTCLLKIQHVTSSYFSNSPLVFSGDHACPSLVKIQPVLLVRRFKIVSARNFSESNISMPRLWVTSAETTWEITSMSGILFGVLRYSWMVPRDGHV